MRYQLHGKRTSELFKTKAEAETAASQVRLKVANEGAAGFSLPRDVQVEAAAAVETLKAYEGETIAKAVEFYVAHSLRFRNAPPVAEIIKEFIAEREKLNQRDRNLADVRQRLNVFARTFGTRKLAGITVEELATWLRDPTWSARSQIHYRRRVSMLYDFGIKRRWCEVNTAALLDNPETEDKDVECFTVEECARILEHADETGCLPLVVFSLFVGLRRAEVARLQWENVNLAEHTVTVGSKTAKKRSQRVVSINDTRRLAGDVRQDQRPGCGRIKARTRFSHQGTGDAGRGEDVETERVATLLLHLPPRRWQRPGADSIRSRQLRRDRSTVLQRPCQ